MALAFVWSGTPDPRLSLRRQGARQAHRKEYTPQVVRGAARPGRQLSRGLDRRYRDQKSISTWWSSRGPIAGRRQAPEKPARELPTHRFPHLHPDSTASRPLLNQPTRPHPTLLPTSH